MTSQVSVIIPTYNRADLLPEAIQSVLAQTYTDFELIIIDDGSKDNTRQVIESFQDKRIRYIYQENEGITRAMNTGLKTARGEFISRLDSDDCWLATILEEHITILKTQPDIGVVYSKAQAMDINGKLLPKTLGTAEHFPGETFKSLLYGDFGCSISTTVRRTCYERIGGFDDNLKANEDWDIWIRLARHYHFYFIDKVLAYFRHHPKRSTASSLFEEVLSSRLYPLDKAFSEANLPANILAIKSLAYRNAHIDIGLRWMGTKNYRQAYQHFWQAIQVSGQPLSTTMRIARLIIFERHLSKYAWSAQLAERIIRLQRRKKIS